MLISPKVPSSFLNNLKFLSLIGVLTG
jgi:hypothetical protein